MKPTRCGLLLCLCLPSSHLHPAKASKALRNLPLCLFPPTLPSPMYKYMVHFGHIGLLAVFCALITLPPQFLLSGLSLYVIPLATQPSLTPRGRVTYTLSLLYFCPFLSFLCIEKICILVFYLPPLVCKCHKSRDFCLLRVISVESKAELGI